MGLAGLDSFPTVRQGIHRAVVKEVSEIRVVRTMRGGVRIAKASPIDPLNVSKV